ncbi:MAG: flagellar type III secretion system pore protein FliP [Phycisphaera sp.]|nr:flagellar type III secretion system pore protein FliP [Phycisphaera sp.]
MKRSIPRGSILLHFVAVTLTVLWFSNTVSAQDQSLDSRNAQSNVTVDPANPLTVLDGAARLIPERFGGSSHATDQAPTANTLRPSSLSTPISIMLMLTVLTVAPGILILCTSFTRIVVVLSLLRQAIGTQSLPPSQVIVGLSLFLTFLVMAPTLDRMNKEFLQPMQQDRFENYDQAWAAAREPMRDFMFAQIDHAGNWSDIYLILNYRGVDTSDPARLTRGDVDMLTLVPAFILSELKTAFLLAFRLYLPFLIIDMVVSSVLISMGMLMLPPVLISLPFKLLLFVLVDGWMLVTGNLLSSFAVPGVTT